MGKTKTNEERTFFEEIFHMENKQSFKDWTLKKTRVYVKERKWELLIETPNYIDYKTRTRLEETLKERVPSIYDVELIIDYPNKKEWFYDHFNVVWKDIKANIKKDLPSCLRWLSHCSAEIKEQRILLTFDNPMILRLLKEKALDKYIQNWIKESFDIKCKVGFLVNKEDIEVHKEEYIVNKQQEDSSFIKDAIKNNIESNNKKTKSNIVLGRSFKGESVPIDEIREDSGKVIVKGQVFDIETRETRSGKIILKIEITDFISSITLKIFSDKDKASKITNSIMKGDWVRARGECTYDKYQREVVLFFSDLLKVASEEREDEEPQKRIELHLHTQMSAMDAVSSVDSLVARAAKWGHPAIAITDHGVLQSFPNAYAAGKKHGIKIIYGLEAYLINDCKPMVLNGNYLDFNQSIVVLDIETTGLDAKRDRITEIGAIKVKNKKVVDSFQTFVNPEVSIPYKITGLTGITDDMVKHAPLISQALELFKDFCGDSALAAHNAPFDMGFIRNNAKSIGWEINNPILDTLTLSRELIQDLKRHRLNQVAKYFGVKLENHHRAQDDALATAKILIKLIQMLEEKGVKSLGEINSAFTSVTNLNALPHNHAIILVKDKVGLKNLYKLVSKSHMDHFYRRPRLPKSLLMKYREGLLIGSACEAGEIFRAMVNGSPYSEIMDTASFYDYLEIQPIANNEYLVRQEHVKGPEVLEEINRNIVKMGERLNKPVVATGDVHFLDPHDEYFRRILMSGQGFSDADHQPPLFLKTTKEMLDDFKYLGEEVAMDVVVNVPGYISDLIEDIQPIPDGLFTPEIPGAEEQIKEMSLKNAKKVYGNPLPDVVARRLDKELNSIIKHGFAVLYLISHKLVNKSLMDGYLVGSRGSVGSSFVAYLTDITEVNPLPPHYICPQCKHNDFNIDKEKYGVGVDLPMENCSECGIAYIRDGFDIPFEVFLGFEGDKVPDIDLNFSGEYQSMAHKYTEELFGEGYVYRAGTIGTIAQKTAYGFVKKYLDEKEKVVSNAEINRLVAGCTGVKRTTGQHPGGVMVVPKSHDIFDFTPIQYPADSKDSGVITTHFDYNFIHDRLVKLDILGHDDPTIIKMLEDITGENARNIPLDEEKTMSIFSGTESLGIKPEDINSPVGTFGIPEFGTRFVRQMLVDTKPTTFGELVRISGLSHGTDVWINNAQNIIKEGIAQLSQVISTRDDIMIYLIYKGVDPTMSFQIMENVRRGRGLTYEFESAMVSKGVPEWFITSCKKIKYMFPKAHAAAYVIMAFRIAYFKVHHPQAFYTAYFTIKAGDFDADFALGGKAMIKDKIQELQSKGNTATVKERSLLTILEVILEMYLRGISFVPVDLYNSHPTEFLITSKGIRPPLNTLQGVGTNAAQSIAVAREEGEFISLEDLRERTTITKTSIEVLKKHGALNDMPETNQLSLF